MLHAILDRQVDGLESVLDNIEARIETLEDAVFARPRNAHIASLLSVKRNILELRRWTAKQREVLLRLGRREFALISAEEALLFRDVHDHLVRINDLLEGFRDMLTSIQEAYLSAVSNRTNDIMRFLTLFSTIMMPLTVLTGVYGMNFEHMPELRSVLRLSDGARGDARHRRIDAALLPPPRLAGTPAAPRRGRGRRHARGGAQAAARPRRTTARRKVRVKP